MSKLTKQIQPNTIIYIFDPLCGWCYGFTPVMLELEKQYNKDFNFQVWSGGMVTGDRVGPIAHAAGYIEGAYQQVEKTTGIEFGKGFLDGLLKEGSYLYNSENPSLALMAFRKIADPKLHMQFAHEIQKALFYDGTDLNKLISYRPLVEKYDVDWDQFESHFEDSETLDETLREFEYVSKMGVSGFPTVLWFNGEKHYVLSQGYQPIDQMRELMNKAKEIQKEEK